MKKILTLIVVATLLLVATSAQAGPLFDEIGDLLKPLVPDEVSGAFALELRPDGLQSSDGHILVVGSYALVHLVGKPFFFDVWRVSPLGIGMSYKVTGTDYRLGFGRDNERGSNFLYFRQVIIREIKL